MVEAIAKNGKRSPRRRDRSPTLAEDDHLDGKRTGNDPCPALQRGLAEQLVILRAEFQEAVASYSVRVQGLLAHVGDLLVDSPGSVGDIEQKRRARVLRRALDDLESLSLKPAKGRRRDLKVVEGFATKLCDDIAEW